MENYDPGFCTAGLGKSCPEPDPTPTTKFWINRDDFEVVFGVFGVDEKAAREIEAYVGLLKKHVSNLGENWNCMTLLATVPAWYRSSLVPT